MKTWCAVYSEVPGTVKTDNFTIVFSFKHLIRNMMINITKENIRNGGCQWNTIFDVKRLQGVLNIRQLWRKKDCIIVLTKSLGTKQKICSV